MKITRRDFLKTSFWSVISFLGASLQPRLNKSLNHTPNVIILVFDTLSARHLSLYGYQRLTTPHLTQFAEKATVYHRHYAAGNFTSPGVASLLTGLYPWTHRAFEQAGIISKKLVDQNLFRALDNSYQKAAFTQNLWADLFLYQFQQHIDVHFKSTAYSAEDDIYYNNPLWQKDALLAFRAFDDFLEQPFGLPASPYLYFFEKLKRYFGEPSSLAEWKKEYPRGVPNLGKYKLYFVLEKVFEGVRQEIARLHTPFVGYFHFFPPHEPYFPNRRFIGVFNDDWRPAPKPFHPLSSDVPQEQLDQARREYDEYIADVDANFGQLYLHLQETGVLDNSYLIVTSDHGQLFERGVHGHVTPLLYDPVIHIPLIVSAPGQSERRDIYSPTSCVDVLPTLLKITGASLPDWLEGTPLPGFGEEAVSGQPVFAMEAKQNSSFKPLTRATFAMLKGDYKLIWYLGYPGYEDVYELYNLKTDSEELLDLSQSHGEILSQMANELKLKLARADQL
jgi:arylsulfatase A-like enzyme